MKEAAQLARRLRKMGLTVVRARRGGHWKVYDGERLLSAFPHTPTDHRWRANAVAELRRAGVDLPA